MSRKPLDPHLWTIEDTFKNMYSVPVYQRPYSWDLPQIKVFLDDIFNTYKLPESERNEGYFIGSVYIHDRNEKLKGLIQKYEIIDGQQRLTTITLLLLSLYSLAIQYEVPENEQTFSKIKQSLWKYVDRNYDKQNKAVILNSIEKDSFEQLYNTCFDKAKDVLVFCEQYNIKNIFEKRVIENFKTIYNYIKACFPKEEKNDLLDFADYLLNYVQIIAIDSICKISKAFSIFESINSKGKPLDEIDKIKTYIFSEIEESSYDQYLTLWGNLIIETNDQIYDYLYNYIKAYISFYRQNINIEMFKSLCKNRIKEYYNKNSIANALKALLDDMYKKVKYYNMLVDVEKAYNLVKNNEFRFYFTIFNQINYKHPRPLFLRCFAEYDSNNLNKEDLVSIIRETIKFMFEFLTISDRDSKDAITMFSTIMNDIYSRNQVEKDLIINIIANEIISQAVTPERIKSNLENMDAYEQNKKIAVALLSLYESTCINPDGKIRISYDKAYTLLHNYGQTFSLDHLLVQTPEIDSNFKYYKDDDEKLVLKDGHDFDPGLIVSGMEYEQFSRLVLNKIGNLRLWYKDNNSSRQNDALQLNEYSDFVTYSKIKERSKTIINTLIDKCLLPPVYNPNISITSDLKEKALPNMDELIESGYLNIGDKLYILNFKNSEALLLDGLYVNFNGKKIRINDWACQITGWKRVNIYRVVALVGENEPLQQKRLKYINNYNEAASD